MTPSIYCFNKEAHKTATYRIVSTDKGVAEEVYFNGVKYDWDSFNKSFPINPLKVKMNYNNKGENPDKTKDYLT